MLMFLLVSTLNIPFNFEYQFSFQFQLITFIVILELYLFFQFRIIIVHLGLETYYPFWFRIGISLRIPIYNFPINSNIEFPLYLRTLVFIFVRRLMVLSICICNIPFSFRT